MSCSSVVTHNQDMGTCVTAVPNLSLLMSQRCLCLVFKHVSWLCSFLPTHGLLTYADRMHRRGHLFLGHVEMVIRICDSTRVNFLQLLL